MPRSTAISIEGSIGLRALRAGIFQISGGRGRDGVARVAVAVMSVFGMWRPGTRRRTRSDAAAVTCRLAVGAGSGGAVGAGATFVFGGRGRMASGDDGGAR